MASLLFLGITVGRFISGFVADRMGNRNMVRIGLAVIAVGILAVIMPVKAGFAKLAGLVINRFGMCARFSLHHTRNTEELWSGKFSIYHRNSDGKRLYRFYIYTAFIRPVDKFYLNCHVPGLSEPILGFDTGYDGKA